MKAQHERSGTKIVETRPGAGRMAAVTGPRHGVPRGCRLVAGALALALVAPVAGRAEEPASAVPVSPASESDWGPGHGKDVLSYLVPALEIPAFLWTVNRIDRAVYGTDIYGTSWDSGWQHVLHGPWRLDTDPFGMNMIMHPYMGSTNYAFARSAGLSYWESLGYAFAGSFIWETYGETGPPSWNDQIMTGVGGTFLGETLFRMASLVLEGGDAKPGFWRELGATVLSPPTGLNRHAFGSRFKSVWNSNEPATFIRLRLGASLSERRTDQGVGTTFNRTEVTGDFSMAYGLPGKPGYGYERPFDYFHFEFSAVGSSDNSFENVMIRGLLYGAKYSAGDAYRGVWGLYGNYDYISPAIFRVSSTALSLGTTAQWWLSHGVALQGSLLGGLGFGAAGTIPAVGSPALGERNYHFGADAQGLLALRLIFGEWAALDLTAREFYVSGISSDNNRGREIVFRGNGSLTVRVYGHHGLGIQYVQSRRNGYYPDLPTRRQTVETFSLAYNYLADTRFGAVEWRDLDADRR
jgi:Domain of unknown function (DUF3943)